MVKISQRRLAHILGISERAVRKRNGISLPNSIKGQYDLPSVLWFLGSSERSRVASAMGIDVDYLQMVFICGVHSKGDPQ